jgi:GT2 family glycosyltransferase
MIQTGANLGFAGGNNVGIRYACAQNADYILLLNNDAFFRSTEALSAMIDFMERTPHAGACGGRLFYTDGSPQQSYGNFPAVLRILAYLFPMYKLLPHRCLKRVKRSNVVPDDTVQEPIRIDWPSGACLMVRVKTIEQVGLLDEQYFLYVEETDWCFRMQAQGWDRYYLPQVEVIHAFGGTVRNSSVSMQSYHLESQFTYYQKHFSKQALAVVAAGYMLRSFISVPFCKIAARVLPDRRINSMENTNYWLLALHLAMTAMRRLVSRDNDFTKESSTAIGPKSTRHV